MAKFDKTAEYLLAIVYSAVWIRLYVENWTAENKQPDGRTWRPNLTAEFRLPKFSALWSNLAFPLIIISALWFKIRPFGFLMIGPSGFGLTVQFDLPHSLAPNVTGS